MERERVVVILYGLAALPGFPTVPEAIGQIAKLAMSIASNEEQVQWLVDRMTDGRYAEWPGPAEMRACFESRFRSKDSASGPPLLESDRRMIEEAAPNPSRELKLIEGQIAEPISVAEVARAKAMPRAEPAGDRFAKALEEILTPPHLRPADPEPTPQTITAEECEREVAENRRRKGEGIEEFWLR